MASKLSPADFEAIKGMEPGDRQDVVNAMGDDDAQAFFDYLHQSEIPKQQLTAGSVLPMAQVPYAPGVAPPGNNTTEEKPAPIGTFDRAFAQNFRNTPEDKISYLKAMYPEMDFKAVASSSGNPILDAQNHTFARAQGQPPEHIYARPLNKTQSPWQALAPDGPDQGAAEMGKKVLDNAFPLAVGLAQGQVGAETGLNTSVLLKEAEAGAKGIVPSLLRAATKAPLIGGTVEKMLPLGTAGAAMGAMGAGADAARQAAGNVVPGVPNQQFNPAATEQAGEAGMVTPFLFGTGASRGAAREANIPLSTQRGIPSRALNAATTGMGSFISSTPLNQIENAVTNLGGVKALEKAGPDALMDMVQSSKQAVRDGLFSHQKFLGNQIASLIANTGEKVDVRPARQVLESEIQKLQDLKGTPAWDKGVQEKLAALRQAHQDIFQYEVPGQPGQPAALPSSLLGPNGQPINPGSPAVTATPSTYASKGDFVDAPLAMQIRSELQNLGNFAGMKGANARGGNNAMSAADKELQRLGSTAYGELDSALDNATQRAGQKLGTGGLNQLNSQYADLKKLQTYTKAFLDDSMKSDDQAGKIMMNLQDPRNGRMRDVLQRLDNQAAAAGRPTNVVRNADVLAATGLIGNKYARGTVQSSFGSTATEKGNKARAIFSSLGGSIGGLLGHKIAPEDYIVPSVLAGAGAAAGGAFGGTLASPAALRTYMNIGYPFRALGDAAGGGFGLGLRPLHTYSNQYLLPGTLPSAWQYLKDQ